MLKRFKALAGAGVALMLVAGCGGHGGEGENAEPERARAVTVAPVTTRALEGGVVASGQLVAREEAAVAAEVTGFRVERVAADIGDTVQRGQVLVQLDDTLLRSQIQQQTALVAQAEVSARQAAEQAARVEGLEGTGALSKEQIDQRRFQAETAQATLAAQQAALADLQTRASKMAVRAPVGGLVIARNVAPGELSGTNAQGPMFRIARDSLIELAAEVPESSMRSIQSGAPAAVTLPNGELVQGQVRLIEPMVQAGTRLGVVRIALPASRSLRVGGSATAQFNDLRADVLSVPETAVNYDADGASVYIVNDESRVEKVAVETGRRGGGFVELIQGPPAGARVLVNAGSFVLEGDLVDVVEAP